MSVSRISVCPHDTAKNITGWFLLNTYLQRKLDCAIRFVPKDNFMDERANVLDGGCQIVYANPFSAAIFGKELGFIPVAKPIGMFDETLLVSRVGENFAHQRPIRIASATDQLIVHTLGLLLLRQLQIPISDCAFRFVGTHLKAVQSVLKGESDLGFVYNETWHGMAASTRQELAIVGQTDTRQAYHCFCVAPEWKDKCEKLQTVLCSMNDEPQGVHILADLNFPSGFEPVSPNDLESVSKMIEEMSQPDDAAA